VTDSQLGLFAAKHLNNNLFSDHYLNDVVPTLALWQDPVLHTQVRALRDELREVLANVQPASLSEPQLEEQWIKPILRKLGHHFAVQVNIRFRDKHRTPDYVFAASTEAVNAFTRQIYEPKEIAHAIAVGDAKKWGVNLDQSGKGEQRNPSQQIDEYLRYTELTWGILTDGRYWRLYERSTSKNNDYYAVDLVALLNSENERAVDNFYYFYLFFRREAFEREGWLDQVFKGSVDYAESLSETLEDEVYEALVQIAQGFFNYRRNRLTPDAATLKLVYEQSLILLYRLLFVLYAESRDVFPLSENSLYAKHQSLTAIKLRLHDHIDLNPTRLEMLVDNTEFYTRLNDLFFIIDSGSEVYDVPPYNGRLFSEIEHPFLAEKRVGDKYLIKAIDRLARVPDRAAPNKRVFVDYRDLSVRHLGAIYEKLLEYQLDAAAEPLTVKEGKYVPAKAGETATIEAGAVYLKTGSNQRKVTGSYYTPDYVVTFIVEHTLDPLLNEITDQYATLDAEGLWQVADRDAARGAVLALNVLDPATGSGHFLVEAVAHIADWLRRLNLQPDDLAPGEDELVYWKRQVVSACIYGVDVNPLAVELARLSLWLTTIARGKPLSFLDHHITVGNTLVGTRAAELSSQLPDKSKRAQSVPPEQKPLFDETNILMVVSDAVDRMRGIEDVQAATIAQVKEQEKSYDVLHDELRPLQTLADVWTARYFGLELTADQWRKLYEHLVSGADADDDVRALLKTAAELAAEYRFFHWEFAFPEVFFDGAGKPIPGAGFDAVIGNPPYVRQERIKPYKAYFAGQYKIHQGTADLFLYFYERALTLVKPSRHIGYITSGTFMNTNSAGEFRRYIHNNAAFDTVINFGENQPFKGAEMVFPTIAILRHGKPTPTFRSLFVEDVYRRSELGKSLTTLPLVETLSDVTSLAEWRFQSVELTQLFGKIIQGQQTLDDAVSGKIHRGITTGLNEAFVIDAATRQRLIAEHAASAEVIKPMLRGEDLRPWYQIDGGQYLIFTRQGIDIEQYPAIKGYLEQFHTALEPMPPDWKGTTDDWPGRKAGPYEWYEIQDNIAYHAEFEKPKIVWSDISKLPRFSWNEASYLNNTGFMIPDTNHSVLALLQSRCMWFALSQFAQPLRLRAGLWQYRVIAQFAERLPIPALTAAQEASLAEVAEDITARARSRYQLHEGLRRRITSDLGGDGKLNDKLENWWALADFNEFRTEVKKALKADIPLAERGEWEKYLSDQQAQHSAASAAIVTLETRMNAVVYEAFKLTPEEITLIERATKYPYGEV